MMNSIVIIPLPVKGHLVSTFQFAKHLLRHDHTHKLSVTLLIIPQAFSMAIDDDDANDDGRINYVHIPRVDVDVDGALTPESLRSSPEKFITDYLDSYKSHLVDAVSDIIVSPDMKLVGVVADMFCASMIDVANAFGVPCYVFFCANAGFFGFLNYLSTRSGGHVIGTEESEFIVPSFENPVPATSLPEFAFNKDGFDAFVSHVRRFKETKGIFINTFPDLEPHAVRSLVHAAGSDESAPPVYTVGPLLDLSSLKKKSKKSDDDGDDQGDEVMKWLDKQPPSLWCCYALEAWRL